MYVLMRRHPVLLVFLVLGLGLASVVIYFTAQMRMRTPPQMVVVRQEWMPRGNVPNAYLRIHYEMKNTTLFPVRVHQVAILGPECLFGGDIDAIYPDKDALLLKPGQVHKGSINISLPEGEPFMDVAFQLCWEPGVAPRLRPLLYRLDDTYREVAKIPPPDPFAPASSPPAPPSVLELRKDVLESMHIERPRSTTP
jgi:hypothetical protein